MDCEVGSINPGIRISRQSVSDEVAVSSLNDEDGRVGSYKQGNIFTVSA
jgi:hypothetical protein